MCQQKRGLLKKYQQKSLYYKFYFLPLLMLLLAVAYSIYLGLKGFIICRYAVLAARHYIYKPMSSFIQKYRLYLQGKISLLRL